MFKISHSQIPCLFFQCLSSPPPLCCAVTPECGSIPEVPEDLDECLQMYCNAGVNEGNKPPNVDIGGVNERMKSMSNARRYVLQPPMLQDVNEGVGQAWKYYGRHGVALNVLLAHTHTPPTQSLQG